jgi:hypothetical protein
MEETRQDYFRILRKYRGLGGFLYTFAQRGARKHPFLYTFVEDVNVLHESIEASIPSLCSIYM